LALNIPPPNPFRRDPSWFRPGATTDRGGVYIVHHYAHRVPHPVTIPAGTELPKCKVCGNRVQYAPVFAAEPLNEDAQLQVVERRRKRAS
jgi:hypothetical protein